jgi:hypothetical protein
MSHHTTQEETVTAIDPALGRRLAEGLLSACRNPDLRPDFAGCGGPAAEAYWEFFTPATVLTLLDALDTTNKLVAVASLSWDDVLAELTGRHGYGYVSARGLLAAALDDGRKQDQALLITVSHPDRERARFVISTIQAS